MAIGGVKKKQPVLEDILFSAKQFQDVLNTMSAGHWLIRQSSIEHCLAVTRLLADGSTEDIRFALIKEPHEYAWRLVNEQSEINALKAKGKIQPIKLIKNISDFIAILLVDLYKKGYEREMQMSKPPLACDFVSDHNSYLIAYNTLLAQQAIKQHNFAQAILAQDEEVRRYGFGAPSP